MISFAENLSHIEEQVTAACRLASRSRSEVELMAVSKTYPAETVLEAASNGLTLFGENRVQEFMSKASALEQIRRDPAQPAKFHLIGHLQSNKALRAVELFDAVDSVHSLRLAERLNDAAGKLSKRLPILLEVKLSPEETKEGLDPESRDAVELLERLPDLIHLDPQGLMTIAPWGAPDEVTRACFRSLRQLRDRWAAAYPRLNLSVLSMGMSGDFPLAIEEGATRIRIGTALFGKRVRR